jgi:hypothetical protein
MPSMSNIKLTSVAGEYLRNFEDLEAARTIFLDERAKVLDSRDDAYGAYDVNIDAKYVAVRERDGINASQVTRPQSGPTSGTLVHRLCCGFS